MANSYIYDLTDSRWTNGNTAYDGIKLTVNSSNSSANSSLLKLVYNGNENFRVKRDGSLKSNGTISGILVSSNVAAPATSSDNGTVGEIRYDSHYVYVCVGTNEWKRSELTTW